MGFRALALGLIISAVAAALLFAGVAIESDTALNAGISALFVATVGAILYLGRGRPIATIAALVAGALLCLLTALWVACQFGNSCL